ncbi:ethionine resistance protein [Coemansia spiralis]|uniref:Ethionine resistance protein n=2 Tax=Coemansia TaxID=4863 RepID=A0A9W8GA27_9FUNG|nr:mate-domain-containing protein [Coemansia spiralis]KAJ1992884.1 ethionine resistance protein [Coemansia umbellata]KAJ2622819.1 ethionine resistance protein [Coemansia sp. RSA 1358]KAJ2678035.1 ethionine resistance protein [Coemansia spiralis]
MNSPSYSCAICAAIIGHSPEHDNSADSEGEDTPFRAASAYKSWTKEAQYQFSKALPMAIAGSIRSWTSILELRALGHVGYKPLAGRSLALLIVNVTGYPIMYGLGGALESLCSQAFTNPQRNKRVGVYVQHSLWVFLIVNIFITVLWLNPGVVFRMLAKTDSEVIEYAKTYLVFECIYFPCVIVQTCLKRFILAQGLMRPTIWFELSGLIAMFVSLQLLVPSSGAGLGFIGVPLSATIAYIAVLVANILYICYWPCRAEWGAFTMAGFKRTTHLIISLGVPCGVSGIASYGFADLATIAVAALGPESLAIQAVLNSSKSAISRTGSYLGMVISNRVGNLIGARKPIRAFLSAKVSITVTCFACSLLALAMLLFQKTIAAFITKDELLISGLLPLLPLLVLVVVLDMISNVLTGVLRGQGRQGVAAIIRVISLYVIALPLAYALAFYLDLGLYGMWAGLSFGFVLITMAEGWLVFASDWSGEVERSIQRINGPKSTLVAVNSHYDETAPLIQGSHSNPERMC